MAFKSNQFGLQPTVTCSPSQRSRRYSARQRPSNSRSANPANSPMTSSPRTGIVTSATRPTRFRSLLLFRFERDVPFGAGGLQASLGAAASSTDLNFPYQLPLHDRVFTIAETHLFSPLVNDFRFGLVHINNSGINVSPSPPATWESIGHQQSHQQHLQVHLRHSGFQFGPTPPANQYQTQNNFNFVENLSWVHGAHTTHTSAVSSFRVNLEFSSCSPRFLTGRYSSPTSRLPRSNDFQNFLSPAT